MRRKKTREITTDTHIYSIYDETYYPLTGEQYVSLYKVDKNSESYQMLEKRVKKNRRKLILNVLLLILPFIIMIAIYEFPVNKAVQESASLLALMMTTFSFVSLLLQSSEIPVLFQKIKEYGELDKKSNQFLSNNEDFVDRNNNLLDLFDLSDTDLIMFIDVYFEKQERHQDSFKGYSILSNLPASHPLNSSIEERISEIEEDMNLADTIMRKILSEKKMNDTQEELIAYLHDDLEGTSK